MMRLRSPNGAEWSVVDVDDGLATLNLERLPNGDPATLRNEQVFSVASIREGKGWTGVTER